MRILLIGVCLSLAFNVTSARAEQPISSAVVRVSGATFCTGTFVTPHIVLTAYHCVASSTWVTQPETGYQCTVKNRVDYPKTDHSLLYGCYNPVYIPVGTVYPAMVMRVTDVTYSMFSQQRQLVRNGNMTMLTDNYVEIDWEVHNGMSGSALVVGGKVLGVISYRYVGRIGGGGYPIPYDLVNKTELPPAPTMKSAYRVAIPLSNNEGK